MVLELRRRHDRPSSSLISSRDHQEWDIASHRRSLGIGTAVYYEYLRTTSACALVLAAAGDRVGNPHARLGATPMLGATSSGTLPAMGAAIRSCREELEALIRHCHHLESEHRHARPDGTVRHHLQADLRDAQRRFEHLLAVYVPDEEDRRAWLAFLHHRGAEPAGPAAISPLVFKGRSASGSVVEIRRDPSGGLAVDVDGRLMERLTTEQPPLLERPAVYQPDGAAFTEIFDAQPGALAGLQAFLNSGGTPPWEHASSLLSDGLIDVNFGLTARGRRALRR